VEQLMPIRTRLSRVTVKETEISASFKTERGSVRQQMRKTAFYHVAFAQQYAPERTGALKESIGYRILPAFNAYETMYSLTVGVPYAEYTLRPTGPVIRSGRMGGAMLVRPVPYSRYAVPTLRRSVKGYFSRDWLGDVTIGVFKALRLN
jgi:hypothetical protein